jgi:exodeoxyribonuclease V alpha subunit
MFIVCCLYTHNSKSLDTQLLWTLLSRKYMMLSRNLIYTGLTRAKELAIIVGSKKAIGMAVRSVNQKERYTQLRERLAQMAVIPSG